MQTSPVRLVDNPPYQRQPANRRSGNWLDLNQPETEVRYEKTYSGTLVVAFGVGIIALGGPKFWEKKDFSDWSKKEIKLMLTKSPWARSVTIRLGGLQPSGPQAAGGGPGGLAGGGAGNTQGGEPPVGGGGSRAARS